MTGLRDGWKYVPFPVGSVISPLKIKEIRTLTKREILSIQSKMSIFCIIKVTVKFHWRLTAGPLDIMCCNPCSGGCLPSQTISGGGVGVTFVGIRVEVHCSAGRDICAIFLCHKDKTKDAF